MVPSMYNFVMKVGLDLFVLNQFVLLDATLKMLFVLR